MPTAPRPAWLKNRKSPEAARASEVERLWSHGLGATAGLHRASLVGRATDRPARKAPRTCSVSPLAVLRRESWTSSRRAPAAVRGTGQGASDGGGGSVRGGFGASAGEGGLDVHRSSDLCMVHWNKAKYRGSRVSQAIPCGTRGPRSRGVTLSVAYATMSMLGSPLEQRRRTVSQGGRLRVQRGPGAALVVAGRRGRACPSGTFVVCGSRWMTERGHVRRQ